MFVRAPHRVLLTACAALTGAVLVADGGAARAECLGVQEGVYGADDSRACLSCHDGSVAPAAPTFGFAGAPRLGALGQHPVDIDYGRAYVRSSNKLVAPQALDPRVQLAKGKIQCSSCHTTPGRGFGPASLVMPNQGSLLCFACHRM